jgi:phenylalanine-4-hydroxylase
MKPIYVITTGGTIEKVYSERSGSVENFNNKIEKYLRLLRLPDSDVNIVALLNKDSLEMSDADRESILGAVKGPLRENAPIVITHGTDTMVETGLFLKQSLSDLRTPIALTGAMVPLGFEGSDGLQNLTESLFAVRVLSPGIYIVMHNQVFPVDCVKKDRALARFVWTEQDPAPGKTAGQKPCEERVERTESVGAEPLVAAAPYLIQQRSEDYTAEKHEIWAALVRRRRPQLEAHACREYLAGYGLRGIEEGRLPNLCAITDRLKCRTGWSTTPVSGFLPSESFFEMLAARMFPTTTWLRGRDSLEYTPEPDIFHYVFGPVPMHAHPVFADFLQHYGRVCSRLRDREALRCLGRLFWYTVEFGLIRQDREIRIYGSGS